MFLSSVTVGTEDGGCVGLHDAFIPIVLRLLSDDLNIFLKKDGTPTSASWYILP